MKFDNWHKMLVLLFFVGLIWSGIYLKEDLSCAQ